MKVHVLKQEQELPVSREEAWAFFSAPMNLDAITPDELGFRVEYTSDMEGSGESGPRMYEGQIITYRIRVFPLVTVSWVTEIRCVDEGKSFIDEQRFGPYRLWHHRHVFEETERGVMMTDLVHYVMPFGWIGEVVHRLFVRRKLERIFDFRREVLEKRFGKSAE